MAHRRKRRARYNRPKHRKTARRTRYNRKHRKSSKRRRKNPGGSYARFVKKHKGLFKRLGFKGATKRISAMWKRK